MRYIELERTAGIGAVLRAAARGARADGDPVRARAILAGVRALRRAPRRAPARDELGRFAKATSS